MTTKTSPGRPLAQTVTAWREWRSTGLDDHTIADKLGIAHLSLRRQLLRAKTRGLL